MAMKINDNGTVTFTCDTCGRTWDVPQAYCSKKELANPAAVKVQCEPCAEFETQCNLAGPFEED